MNLTDIEFIFTYDNSKDADTFLELTEKFIGINSKNEFERAASQKTAPFSNQ